LHLRHSDISADTKLYIHVTNSILVTRVTTDVVNIATHTYTCWWKTIKLWCMSQVIY